MTVAFKEGDIVHVVRGVHASDQLAEVVKVVQKSLYVRFEDEQDEKLVRKSSVIVAEAEDDITTLTRTVIRLQAELNKQEEKLYVALEKEASAKAREREAASFSHETDYEKQSSFISTGDKVRIDWDRHFVAGRKHAPRTKYEGKTGLVVRETKCFVWVRVDNEKDVVLKKRRHNVSLLE